LRRAIAIAIGALIVHTARAADADPPPDASTADPASAPLAPPGATVPSTTAPSSAAATLGDDGTSVSPEEIEHDLDAQPAAPASDGSTPTTGTIRVGAYHDSDQTTVYRALGTLAHTFGRWSLNSSFGVDAVTSASVDVRSSPALSKVDVVTSASGRSSSSGGQMTDTRYQLTGGAGWNDSKGATASFTGAVAKENDYASVSGGVNGSYDVLDRTLTLLGGFTLTDNWVSSVLDPTLHHKMVAAGWSLGMARVLTPDDALRVRYDGKYGDGYLSSPYRDVRFGDWTAVLGMQQITFSNTIGSAAGLPEHEPETRLSHAVVFEWVHSLAAGVALHPEVRLSHDSWNLNSLGAGLDLRLARPDWRLQAGYRFYLQGHADFFEDKYTLAPSAYTYYTSDKELGDQVGHIVRFDFAHVVMDADGPNDNRLLFTFQLDLMHYSYPGFLLLSSRDSVFGSIGLSWEP